MFPLPQSGLSRCRLGVGRVDITPPADAYHRSWGAALHDAAEGIHRPLHAIVLVFEDESAAQRRVLCTMDLGWLRAREMARLVQAICSGTGLTTQDVVVTFSHTHAAINLDTERRDEPGGQHIEPYLAALPDHLLTAYAEATDNIVAVDLATGAGRCALGMHRDARDEERGIYVCGPNPGHPVDDTLLVTRATDDAGRTVAHVVNYACHPTTLAWGNRLISPDYIGAMREVIENATEAPCAFLQGAAGDIGPVRGFVGDVETADSNGRQLGYAALAAIEAMPAPGRQWQYEGPMVSGATVGVWDWHELPEERATIARQFDSQRITIQLTHRQLPCLEQMQQEIDDWSSRQQTAQRADDEAAVREARARIERLRRRMRMAEATPAGGLLDFDITLWRLGETVFVMVGGEPYQQLQVNLRRRFPRTQVVVVELCNQPASYMLPQDRYGIGLYQEEVCVLAPGCLEAVEEAAAEALAAWNLT